MSDEYDISDLERDFHLGNYQSCIRQSITKSSSREFIYYMCLSYCYLRKYDNLNLELSKWDDDAGKVIRLYADHARGGDDGKEIIERLDSLLDQIPSVKDDELSSIIASALYARLKSHSKALQLIDRFDSLVATYSKISILIIMNRVDLAEKRLVSMMKQDEQSPLTRLAEAQVSLANSNPTKSWMIAANLSDSFKPTPLLFNLQVASAICSHEYEKARELCENALDMDSENLEALINMVHILSKLRSSSAVLTRNLDRLTDTYPDNDFVKKVNGLRIDLQSL